MDNLLHDILSLDDVDLINGWSVKWISLWRLGNNIFKRLLKHCDVFRLVSDYVGSEKACWRIGLLELTGTCNESSLPRGVRKPCEPRTESLQNQLVPILSKRLKTLSKLIVINGSRL